MKKNGRYKTNGLVEDQYEEGSDGLVLKNLLSINAKQAIDEAETRELYRATDELTEIHDQNHRFTSAGNAYGLAGRIATLGFQ